MANRYHIFIVLFTITSITNFYFFFYKLNEKPIIDKVKTSFPKTHYGTLTQIIIPFYSFQKLKKSIHLWNKYTPCKKISIPELLFVYTGNRTIEKQEKDLFYYFNQLPKQIKTCFQKVNLIQKKSLNRKQFFETLLDHNITFSYKPSYIFLMETNLKPIQNRWLDSLYYSIITPNSPFWIKGGIEKRNYKGYFSIHYNSIINLEDSSLKNFYFNLLKPYYHKRHFIITKYYDVYDFGEMIEDHFPEFHKTKEINHKYLYTELILDNSDKLSIHEILKEYPNTFFYYNKYDW